MYNVHHILEKDAIEITVTLHSHRTFGFIGLFFTMHCA